MKSRHVRNKEKDHLARLKKKHRAEFFANLKIVCNQLAGYDLYPRLPLVFLEKIYTYRLRQIRIIYDELVFTPEESEKMIAYISAAIQASTIEGPHGVIKLSHMLVEGHSLILLARELKDDEFFAAAEIREALKASAADDFQIKFHTKAREMLMVAGFMASTIDRAFVHGKMTLEPTSLKTSLQYKLNMEKVNCSKETFVVDGHARPAYRVGWALPFNGMDWAEIKAGQEGITQATSMPVFIQAHALKRLVERTDLNPGVLHFFVYLAIRFLEYTQENNGKLLISYLYYQKKIGYLVGSVVNQRLLLHTFLFITNNGTPEGKKLSQLTGLQPLDKKYLSIDKLSTFLSYKINDHPFVKDLFVQAGCGHLLEIEDKSPFLYKPGIAISAETIANYLKANLFLSQIPK